MASLQTAALWGVFLWLIPSAIIQVQARVGISRFDAGMGRELAVCLFVAAGMTGWYCGWLFVEFGGGTPMPTDQTKRLVILGPYRFVRNPMATLGILQGLALGIWLGSWPVLYYALVGGVAWHTIARPYEEADLERRYGARYGDYRAAVRNWLLAFSLTSAL